MPVSPHWHIGSQEVFLTSIYLFYSMCVMCSLWCLWRSEEGTRSSETGVSEVMSCHPGTKPSSSIKASALDWGAIFSDPNRLGQIWRGKQDRRWVVWDIKEEKTTAIPLGQNGLLKGHMNRTIRPSSRCTHFPVTGVTYRTGRQAER